MHKPLESRSLHEMLVLSRIQAHGITVSSTLLRRRRLPNLMHIPPIQAHFSSSKVLSVVDSGILRLDLKRCYTAGIAAFLPDI